MTVLTSLQPELPIPHIQTELSVARDPQGERTADLTFGTLQTTPEPDGIKVRGGLYFTPAWNPQAEAESLEMFTDISASEARHEVLMHVAQAARRRSLYGVTWHYERLSARAKNAAGELLASESLGGIPSDMPQEKRRGIEASLISSVIEQAQDWAILGLN